MLCVDNTCAVKLKRSKHIDVRYHLLQDLYNKGEIDITYVTSEE